jgi:hypothetical protein
LSAEKRQWFGYLNRWGRIVVEPYDIVSQTDAMKSPSVFKTFNFIEAETQYEAECEAKRRNESGEGLVTFAGQQAGLK